MPKVSVIVAVYNVAPYLQRSLDSLINQTLHDIEIILIDDCSTDNSLEILKEYAQRDGRIIVIESDVNGGAAIARNKGLAVAKGEYLGFIDPDDAIDLNYYEVLYNKAKKDNATVVKCERKTIFSNGKVKLSNLNKNISNKGLHYFTYEWTTAIYNSKFIFENNIKFPEECIKAQDVVFLAKIMTRISEISLVDGIYYYYYKRVDSLNAKKINLEKVKSALIAITLILEEVNKNFLTNVAYLECYILQLFPILTLTLFQNDSFEAKNLCAKYFIKNFYYCKKIELLKDYLHTNYPYIYECVVEKDVKKLTKLFLKSDCLDDLKLRPLSFLQRVFSIQNYKNRKHKIVTILGIKINIRKKEK